MTTWDETTPSEREALLVRTLTAAPLPARIRLRRMLRTWRRGKTQRVFWLMDTMGQWHCL